jgi:hypothetical protein
MILGIKIQQVDRVNVLQTRESEIRPNYQHQLLPREQIWNRSSQNAN